MFASWREDWPIAAQAAIRPMKPTKGGKERASAHRPMLALLFGSPVLWWAVRGGRKACRFIALFLSGFHSRVPSTTFPASPLAPATR